MKGSAGPTRRFESVVSRGLRPLAIFVVFGFGSSGIDLRADTIELDNGTVLEGEIARETDRTVVLRIRGGGNTTISKSEIREMVRGGVRSTPHGYGNGNADGDAATRGLPVATQPGVGSAPSASKRASGPSGGSSSSSGTDSAATGESWVCSYRFRGSATKEVQGMLELIAIPGREDVEAVIDLRAHEGGAAAAIPDLTRMLADARKVSVKDRNWKAILSGPGGRRVADVATTSILAREVAYTLARIGDEALDPTLEALASKNSTRRAYAAMSLVWNAAAKGEGRAIRALNEALDDPEPQVRAEAATSLAHLGGRDSRRILVPLLLDSDANVRAKALDGIESAGIDDSLDFGPLLTAMESSDVASRRNASRALAAIARKTKSESLYRALRGAANDVDADVRANAAGGLSAGTDARALSAATTDEDVEVRIAAVKALRTKAGSAGIQALAAALKDPAREVRREAAVSLARRKEASAIDALVGGLGDGEASVRSACAMALGDIADPRALSPLFDLCLKSGSELKALHAIGSIARKHPGETERFLAPKLSDGEASTRARAAQLLGNVRQTSIIGPLSRALQDSDAGVRSQAIESLGLLRKDEVLPYLVRGLRDEDEKVRAQAQKMLVLVTGEKTIPADAAAWSRWLETRRR